MSLRNFFHRLLQFTVALFLLAQFFASASWVVQNISLIADNPYRTFDEKMQTRLGAYYVLIQFVQAETPRDATLLFDSKSHINLDLYFLYPRKIIYSDDLPVPAPSIDYMVLTGDLPPPAIQGEKKMLDDKRGLIRLR